MAKQPDRRPVERFELIRPSGERLDWRPWTWRDRTRARLENTPRRRYGIIVELSLVSAAAFLLATALTALFGWAGLALWRALSG